ncbi:MAG: ATP-binding protein [Phycisphaerae bacterium]|jgi:signal transduction histidine kinase
MRRVSIRTKLVLLLVTVAALPMLVALLIFTARSRSLGTESVGQTLTAAARARALAFQLNLVGEADKLQVALAHDTAVHRFLDKRHYQRSMEELKILDERWPTLARNHPSLSGVLDTPLSRQLHLLQEDDPSLAEIMVTDRFGQLVASTGRTTDFYQGDEEWWQWAWNGGEGQVYVPPIGYDESSRVWSVDLCVPIRHAETGEVVGIVKAVIDLSSWLHRLPVEIVPWPTTALLVQRDGTVLYRQGMMTAESQPSSLLKGPRPIIVNGPDTWRVSPNGCIYATGTISLPENMGGEKAEGIDWVVVLCASSAEALAEVHGLSMTILLIGLIAIVLILAIALYLSEYGVTRRVRLLAQTAREVAQGDLSRRIAPHWKHKKLTGFDEIDALAADFDTMIGEIQRSYDTIKTANDLKANFIRIAGHEFRTPVSYILGMTRLLRDTHDADRLLHGVQMMGAKAKRLDDITQAMFKLMPEAPYAHAMQYSDVAIKELLEEVYLDSFPFVERRHQKLVVNISSDFPLIRADHYKLRDAVENLVMNAVKFSPDGATVAIKARREGDNVVIEVTDEGVGILPADQPHIFEPFFSGSDVMKHSTGEADFQKRGLGLGLTVVRHFVVLHGGKVTFTTSSAGSTFRIELPLSPPPSQAAGEVE